MYTLSYRSLIFPKLARLIIDRRRHSAVNRLSWQTIPKGKQVRSET